MARLNATTVTPSILERADAWCRERTVRCLSFAACGTCPVTLGLAHEEGFRFVDVRVELTRNVSSQAPAADLCAVQVRRAAPVDHEPLQRLARLAHQDTRFFKDGRFDRSRCAELYATWMARDLESHTVLTFDETEEIHGIGGYVTCEPAGDTGCGRIGLLAVEPRLRGRRFGQALLAAAVVFLKQSGAVSLAVTTQGTNVPALRLYEQAGFRTERVSIWFHKWFW